MSVYKVTDTMDLYAITYCVAHLIHLSSLFATRLIEPNTINYTKHTDRS
ncbi:hypothetical protein MADA3029_910043 [Vibrio nigripulchritudo MADA3029]|nr:hypothetical protein VIBNIMADA3020_810044 [Vibrio nigripulchritudo MADA3020]CCN62043.1 hypothetical protein MADA3029_910043 [Vibrio nigripulchritudo MADA3029]